MTYEGWKNRETWAVNLWLANDEPLYNDVRRMAEVARDDTPHDEAVAELEDDIREYVEELVFRTDLLTGSLANVDWREIAEGWLED